MDFIYGRITKTAVERLEPNQLLRDTELKGFAVRSRAKARSYFVQKKVNGRVQWITIGRHGAPWTAETARKRAAKLLLELVNGESPNERKRKERNEASFDEVQRVFLEQCGPKLKPRSRTEYERLLKTVITPHFRTKRLSEISRADISKFHGGLSEVPGRANFALSVLSRLFSWASDHGYDLPTGNPCIRVAKYKLSKRERYLTAEEYARLGSVLAELEAAGEISLYPAAALRLLMLTGARLNEILTLQWTFVRLDRECLFLPDSKTGEKVIRLGRAAIKELQAIPRVESNPYVIVGHVHGTHLINLHKTWALVREKAKLDDVRLHDLRHSFASVAADAGASLPMIGGLLGHADPQTTARYVHLVELRLHELNQRVVQRIGAAVGGRGATKRRKKAE